jgi:predicted phosphodiesterase
MKELRNEKIIYLWLFHLLFLASYPLSAKKADKIRIGMCTDVHLTTMHDSKCRITKFIGSMNIAKPDFIIELGDFVTPEKKYAELFDIWNSWPGDKYHVIGNHEMDGGTSRQAALDYRKMGKSYYSFDKNGFHFIVLDGNDINTHATKGYQQFIGAEQVEWLKCDLEKSEHPVVIFSHQGLAHYQSADESYGVENYQQMQQILVTHNSMNPSKKVIACFNGHTHYDYAENISGIWYITITSMSYHWLGEKYAHVRYSDEVDKNFKWIKYTAPFKDPLFTVVEISAKGTISIAGKKSEWVGPTPWELGYPETLKKYMRPAISPRTLKFNLK